MNKYQKLAQILNEQELLFLEDALAGFAPSYLSESGSEQLQALRSEITMARRWRHQFGKVQR